MVCPNCRTGRLDQYGRCPVCSPHDPSYRRACANCGYANDAKARFCSGCGRPVITLAGAAKMAAAHVHSPLPRSLAARLERFGSAMLGERKQATILFADIRGSTEMVDRLDVEGALAVLAPLLKSMMDSVHQYDGFVNRTVGDGIMALFGAPLANEDHALLACQAAVALRTKVRDVAAGIGEKVELRIGIHSGEVLIHSIGNDLSMNFDAMGKAVHIAARLEANAPPGTIMISADTLSLARHGVEVVPCGSLSLKGIEEPVESFELTRTLPLTRWQTRRTAGLAPLVGRRGELATLAECEAGARAGRLQFVAVTGNPGLGKSRLLHEFVSALPRDWVVLEVAGQPSLRNSPHAALATILRLILNLAVDESVDSARHKLTAVLHRLGAAQSSFEPLAAVVLGGKVVPAWLAADPQEQKARLKAAVSDIALCQARLAPLCIVVEDLQWIDEETATLLEALRPVLEGFPVLIVTSEREPGLLSDRLPVTRRVRLDGLSAADSERLIIELMGPHPSLAHLKQQIVARSEGNPLFIEELVQSLIDAGEVIGAPGSYVATSVMPSLHLPATVHAVLAARVDRLEARQKALLQAASVIGAEWPYWLLARVFAPEHGGLEADIESLRRSGFLFRTASGLEAKYAFKHDLARETVYDMIPRTYKKELHARVVATLEAEYKDRLDDQADALAFHAARAEMWQKAVPYQLRSARRAARRGANRDCIAIVDQALHALQSIPDSDDTRRAKIDFRLLVVTAFEPLGLHDRARQSLIEALSIVESLDDERRAAAIRCQLALAWWRRGEHDKARASAEVALRIANALGDGPLIFAARHNLGIIAHQIGTYREAVEHLETCNAMMSAQHDERRFGWAAYPSVILRTFLSDCLFELGRIDEARTMADAAHDTAVASGHTYSIVQINQVRARILLASGDVSGAVDLMAATWKSVVDNEMLQLFPIMATRYGEALVQSGRPAEALAVTSQPETFPVGEKSDTYGWGQLYCAQSAALLALGRGEEARRYAERSLHFALERGESPQVGYAHRMLALIDSGTAGAADRSALHREKAMRIATASGMAQLSALLAKDVAPEAGQG